MERLLKKANELNKAQGKYTDYQIDSYADIVEAIHVVQDEMGITGTTAEEAATTIEGSLGMVKGSWDNLLVAFARGENVDEMLKKFISSAGTLAQNVIPVAKTALKSIIDLGKEFVPQLIDEAIEGIPAAFDKLGVFVENIGNWFSGDNISTLVDKGVELGGKLLDGIGDNLPKIASTAYNILKSFASNLWENLPQIWDGLVEFGGKIIQGVWDGAKVAFVDFKNWFGEQMNSLAKETEVIGYDAYGNEITAEVTKPWVDKVVSGSELVGGFGSSIFGGASSPPLATIFDRRRRYSHAGGLDYVPYDGYAAMLHKGEKVLTKDEAAGYDSRSTGVVFSGLSINISGNYSDENALAEAIAERLQDMANRKGAVYA